MAEVDQFLMIEGYKGEAADEIHTGEIDVESWEWGMAQSGTTHMGPGAGGGKVSVNDMTVTKYLDRASPSLMMACCRGRHIPKCVLTVRKAGDNPLEYLRITMTDCILSNISIGGNVANERVTENIEINFAEVRCEYTPQRKDGSGEAVVEMGWNIARNAEA